MSVPTLVFRASVRGALGDGLLEHITGVTRPENATAREGWPRVAHLDSDVEGAFGAAFVQALQAQWSRGEGKRLDAKHAAELRRSRRALVGAGRVAVRVATKRKRGEPRRRGRRPSPVVDLLFAGPPRFEGYGFGVTRPWSRDRVEAWERAVVGALREAFPHSRFLAITGHRDERSPHAHAYLVPIDSQGRLGWAHVRRELAARAGCPEAQAEDPSREYVDGKGGPRKARSLAQVLASRERASLEMTHVQDWLWERLGRPHGLERGERGSRRVHRAVDRVASVEGRVREAEARAAAAAKREDEAYRRELQYMAAAEEGRTKLEAEAEKAEERRDTAQADATAAEERAKAAKTAATAEEERKTEAEAAVAAAKKGHQQLEDQYNATRKALRALERENVEAQATRDDLAAKLVQLRQDSKAARERLVAAENAAVAAEDRRRQADLDREALVTAADAAWERLVESDRIFTSPGGLASVFRLGSALGRDPGQRMEIDRTLRKTGHDLREFEEGMTAGVTAPDQRPALSVEGQVAPERSGGWEHGR